MRMKEAVEKHQRGGGTRWSGQTTESGNEGGGNERKIKGEVESPAGNMLRRDNAMRTSPSTNAAPHRHRKLDRSVHVLGARVMTGTCCLWRHEAPDAQVDDGRLLVS